MKENIENIGDNSYIPQSVLITGGAGFIGSHVVDALVQTYSHKCKIVILDRMDYSASFKNIPNVKFVKGDIRSIDLVSYILKEEKIDTILHFAAQTHVDNSFGNSLNFTLDNVYGTHILLEVCREEKIKPHIRRFIYVSTDEVYGETNYGIETTHLDPTNPYSAAKASAEMLCKAYITSYGLPIIITRGNNVYGPRQFPEKLIPRFILLAQQGKKLPIQGSGETFRSFLYVEDVAKAFLTVLHYGQIGQVYNIGTDKEKSVNQVANDILSEHGIIHEEEKRKHKQYIKDRFFNDKRYYIGYDKLLALGWPGQETSWEEGLKKTIAWYKSIDPYSYWKKEDVVIALNLEKVNEVHQSK